MDFSSSPQPHYLEESIVRVRSLCRASDIKSSLSLIPFTSLISSTSVPKGILAWTSRYSRKGLVNVTASVLPPWASGCWVTCECGSTVLSAAVRHRWFLRFEEQFACVSMAEGHAPAEVILTPFHPLMSQCRPAFQRPLLYQKEQVPSLLMGHEKQWRVHILVRRHSTALLFLPAFLPLCLYLPSLQEFIIFLLLLPR